MTNRESFAANHAAGGIPKSSWGSILQRGGEEVALEKVSNRFTVRLSEQGKATDWRADIPADHRLHLSTAELEEFVVDASQRDRVMDAARASDATDFASHVYQPKESPGSFIYLSDRITIQFSPQATAAQIAAIANSVGLRQLHPVLGLPNTFVFQLTAAARENPLKLTNRLMGNPAIVLAEPDIITAAQSFYQPRDSLYSRQWYLNHNGGTGFTAGSHIFAEAAWDITRGDRAVTIAVADDSVDINHPDFQGSGKIVAPRDIKDNDFQPLPGSLNDNHGTACAGVAVAEENGRGIVGVAPGCSLMPIRATGMLDDRSIEALFTWAMEKGADVISCSWGPTAVHFPLSLRQRAIITRVVSEGRNGKGCIVVFAAGNANRPVEGTVNERGWPGNQIQGFTQWLSGFAVHPDVITVSACTSLNKKAAYSNWGESISVCAPSNNAAPGTFLPSTGFVLTPPPIRTALAGQGVFTTDRLGSAGYNPAGDFTGDFGGTSSACPIVAGVAALVLSVNPDLTAWEVKRILQQTADKIVDPDPDPQLGLRLGTYDADGHSQWFGYGKVNAFKAVQAAQQSLSKPKPTPTPTPTPTLPKRLEGSNQTDFAIPDANPQGAVSAITINDERAAKDIQVTVNIAHDFLGDVEIYLLAPSGEKVLLQGRTLGRATQLQKRYSLQNTPALQSLLNQSAQGDWQLQVMDRVPLDTGTLKGWQLSLSV